MTPDQVATPILTALRTIPGITVFDGHVPEKVPTDGAGFVRPYLALYLGGPVGDPDATTVCGAYDTDSTSHTFQTTVVGASAQHVRAVAAETVGALVNLRIGPGRVRPVWEQQAAAVPLLDPATSPARYFLPLQWAITTQ